MARGETGSKFGRLRLALCVQAPEPRLPAEGGALEDELVESGQFRVDPAWMVDKLRAHQLGDPLDFLVPMLRAGAASGATRIQLERAPKGLCLRFDGRPFSARELADPLQALTEGDRDAAARGVHLAYGLLALERLGPELVLVTSGGPSGQATAVLSPRGDAREAQVGLNRAEGTLVQVRWGLGGSPAKEAFRRVTERYGLAAAALSVDGKPVAGPPPPGTKGWHRFEEEGWRGLFRFVEDESPLSRVRLYCLGLFVEEVRERIGYQPLEAYLGSDGLSLDLSQSGVVREWSRSASGASLEAGLDLLRAQAKRYYA